MQTLETDADIHTDGTMTLLSPLPPWLKPGRTHLLLVLSESDSTASTKIRLPLPATPEMLARRKVAYASLRAAGGLGDVIPDPCAWQREIRQDSPLPGRE